MDARDSPSSPHPPQPQPPPQLPPQPQPQPGSATWVASGLSADCMQRVWAASTPSLAEASPREAAMLLWSLASLSVRPPDDWAAALLRAVQPALRAGAGPGTGRVSSQTLGVLVYSLGRLRLRPPGSWMALALAEIEARAAASSSAAKGTAGAGGAVDAGGAVGMGLDPGVVRGLLVGLAELEWPLPEGWLGRVLRDVAPQLLAMRPAHRTQTYAAVASLDAALADRLGYEFCELPGMLAARWRGRGGADGGRAGARWEGVGVGEEGAGQQRSLFNRSRGGWA
ncbi:hypothetical protein GPECTOR_36g49 [Gonium pectorale]|uniref:Uncharacterized protein n=1 Tax=Gonium pectorale TaxID=33097 RepID=A0A150GCN1_GONPE|nr:hypothetical protein GPECTOR_36g49 [Gonium pectorale]|eukprot:KXZ47325.1 hypothetical protein GPECTOR_36g49 [Gonium pectorale]